MEKKTRNFISKTKKAIVSAMLLFLFTLFYGVPYFLIILHNKDKFNLWEDSGVQKFVFGLGICIGLILFTYELLQPRIIREKKTSFAEALLTFLVVFVLFTLFSLFAPLMDLS